LWGRHVDLVGVGHRGDLHRLPDPVPGDVDDRHVHRVALEERAVVAAAEEALARGHRDLAALADVPEPARRARVDLDPQDVERLDGPGDLQESLGLEVEVQVDQDVDIEPGALAERRELVAGRGEHVPVGVELGEALAAREPRVVQARVVPQ
jgi:hypothetical protein